MKLVVGLGNPGSEYKNTRHNIGFITVESYVKDKKNTKFIKKFNGLYTKIYLNNEYFIILKPLSYMNLSGLVVKKYVDYFKINPNDILIIHDDLDMPVGRLKLKRGGSSGGHNGIKSIINELNNEDFNHLKIGIGNNKNIDTKDYVLGKFSDDENKVLAKLIDKSKNIIDDFIINDFDKVMCKYNGDNNEIK